MEIKRYRICISAIILFFLSIFTAVLTFAQEQDKQKILQEFRRRLTDSNGVSVYVDVIAKDKSEEDSLTDELRKDIEGQLKKTKIMLLTREQLEYAPGRPRLGIYIVIYKEPSLKDVYLYSFRIVHFEDAVLHRNGRYAEGICWESGLYVGRERLTSLKRNIRNHVNRYINDYLTANPMQR
jgi:hypothetical protein